MSVAPPVMFRQLTQELLARVTGRFRGLVSATEPGVVAGLALLDAAVAGHDIGTWRLIAVEGSAASAGQPLIEIIGTAGELAAAENVVLGPLGYAGGIAKRCRDIRDACPSDLRVACGGWKKLPTALKPLLRAGLDAGGVTPRLVEGDFVYVDKNTAQMLGGVAAAAAAGVALNHGRVAVQVATADEALAAVAAGARIVMDDTGSVDVLRAIDDALSSNGIRDHVTLAFAGGVRPEDLSAVRAAGADVVDLGRAILDAPLWDLHLEVQPA